MPRPRKYPAQSTVKPSAGLAAAAPQTDMEDDFSAPVQSAPQVERPSLRASMRDDDPRARAAKRAKELLQHLGDSDDETDQFHIDPNVIPEGWRYQWKRHTVMGKEYPDYEVKTARAGWEPVPASRHPELMPKDGNYKTIMREGLILCEIPEEVAMVQEARELRKARTQVRTKEEQLNSSPKDQFQRHKSDGTSLAKVNKHFEPMPIPEE